MALKSINPLNKKVFSEITELSASEVSSKLNTSQNAFEAWKNTSFEERAKLMHQAAKVLRQNKSKYAQIMTNEMGKLVSAARAEVEKSALACDYYADNAEAFLKSETIESDASESFVRHDPIGIVLAVMPWNFPFWQVFRFAAPALMAGNVGVLKHASNVQLCAQAIEDVFIEAGFPKEVFTNLAIGSSKVEAVIRNPQIRAVTLTGSEYAGSQVAKTAGEEIKKTVLELGGSDPFIVLSDADLDEAAKSAVSARMQFNAGQSCISAKRFIVMKDVVDEFTKKLSGVVSSLKIGDPNDPKTDIGPLANEQMLTDIERQVSESAAMGAKIVVGGKRSESSGYFYQPTVLTGITPEMPVFNEEVFGPAIPVIVASSEKEAIDLANAHEYGLGSTIFSNNSEHAKELAAQIDSGAVFINHQVKSDPRLPFGGVKKSGYGRELSHHGIKEFVNIKTIWIK